MKTVALTDDKVDRLPPADKGQYIVRDAKLHGFFVVVGKRAKTWTIQVDTRRLGVRQTHRVALGRAPEMGVKAARAEAMTMIAQLQKGTGAAHKADKVTLGEAWNSYRARLEVKISNGEKSKHSLASYRHRIEGLLKCWLDTPLVDLSDDPKAVSDKHQEIGRTNGKPTADMVMKGLRVMYRFAKASNRAAKLPADLPTSDVQWFNAPPKQKAIAPEDYPEWYRQLRALPNPVRQEFHLFTLLSGMRPEALREARWADLDIERQALHVPDPKGGKRKAFDLPLSRAMLECLERGRAAGQLMSPWACDELIFPGATPGRLLKQVEPNLSHVGTDLRHTFKNAHLGAGIADMYSQRLMNHGPKNVSDGYIIDRAIHTHLVEAQELVSVYIVSRLGIA